MNIKKVKFEKKNVLIKCCTDNNSFILFFLWKNASHAPQDRNTFHFFYVILLLQLHILRYFPVIKKIQLTEKHKKYFAFKFT